MTVLVAISLNWSTVLLRRNSAADGKRFAGGFALALLFATPVHPFRHYAQAEHIMLLLVLTYLVMAAGRVERRAPPTGEAVLVAGIGSDRSRRSARRPAGGES